MGRNVEMAVSLPVGAGLVVLCSNETPTQAHAAQASPRVALIVKWRRTRVEQGVEKNLAAVGVRSSKWRPRGGPLLARVRARHEVHLPLGGVVLVQDLGGRASCVSRPYAARSVVLPRRRFNGRNRGAAIATHDGWRSSLSRYSSWVSAMDRAAPRSLSFVQEQRTVHVEVLLRCLHNGGRA